MLSVKEISNAFIPETNEVIIGDSDAIRFLRELYKALKNEISLCGFCARIGLQFSPDQIANREKILSFTKNGYNAKSALLSVQSDIGNSDNFVKSSEAVHLFAITYPLLAYVVVDKERRSDFSSLTQFCRSFGKSINADGKYSHFLGDERIGCQIDCAPRPRNVRKLAEAAINLNTGYKKKPSQRTEEKERKKVVKKSYFESKLLSIDFEAVQAELIDSPVPSKIAAFEKIFKKVSIKEHSPARTIAILLEFLSLEETSEKQVVFKNLFLRGKEKGTGIKKYFLVSVSHDFEVNYKQLTKQAQAAFGIKFKSDLRQTTGEEVLEILKVNPGEISPLCLVHKPNLYFVTENKVLDENTTIWVHPVTNSATIGVKGHLLNDFIRLAMETDEKILLLD